MGHPSHPKLLSTIMMSDASLELSVEQLISTLNKKLFMECGRVQSEMPPMSRALAATLTVKGRFHELKGDP